MFNLEYYHPHFPDEKIKTQIAMFPEQARSQNHSSSLLCHKSKQALYPCPLGLSLCLEANTLSLYGLNLESIATPLSSPFPSSQVIVGSTLLKLGRNEARVGSRNRSYLLPGLSFPKQSVGICEVCALVGRKGVWLTSSSRSGRMCVSSHDKQNWGM